MTSIRRLPMWRGLGAAILGATAFAEPSAALDADVPYLLGDLRTTPVEVTGYEDYPSGLASLGDRLLFDYCEESTGCEAWVSDGTPEGTRLLADLRLGSGSSAAHCFTVSGPVALFSAAASAYRGAGPWVTDGTPELLHSLGGPLANDPPAGYSTCLAVAGPPATFYYWASAGSIFHLYWYRATGGAPRLLVPILPGFAPDDGAFEARSYDGRLFFSGCENASGCEPWLADGESISAKRLVDLRPGPDGSQPSDFVKLGEDLFFFADDGRGVHGLWRYSLPDGALAPVFHPEPGPDGAEIRELIASEGSLFFAATSAAEGLELWRSDGSAEGTRIVADLLPGPAGAAPEHLTAWRHGLLFVAVSRSGDRTALWTSDGSELGTRELVESDVDRWPDPVFFEVGDETFFNWTQAASGEELWSTDGTPEGTTLVLDIRPGPPSSEPRRFAELSGKLAFAATDLESRLSIWTSDGTAAGTRRAVGLGDGNQGSASSQFNLLGDRLLFVTREDFGRQALRSMEVAAGAPTDRAEVCADPLDGRFQIHSRLAGTLLFEAECGSRPSFYLTAGHAAETTELTGLGGGGRFEIEGIWRAPGGMLASACTAEAGCEPWFLDHSVAGSHLLADLRPGTDSSHPQLGLSEPTGLVFAARQEGTGQEVWIWEGGAEPPRLLAESAPGAPGWVNLLLRVPGGIAFRNGEYASHELLGFDFAQGTLTQLALLSPMNILFSTEWGETPERTLFTDRLGALGEGPWVTDGTEKGSHRLYPAGTGPRDARSYRSIGGSVLFAGSTPETGRELWISDGTLVGTRLVADILPGPGSSSPEELVVAGDRAFFRAHDGVHGQELWTTDGTGAGTAMVADLYAGAAGSAPGGLHAAGGYLFFSAFRPDIGSEPWFLAIPGAPLFADDFETRDLLDWSASVQPAE